MSSQGIRKIGPFDLSGCVQVIRKSFLTVAEEFDFTPENAPRFTAFAIDEERLKRQLEDLNREMYAYFSQESPIVGYASLLRKESNACGLCNLSVLPECRHQGIGQQLLEYILHRARDLGCHKLEIGIVEENQQLKSWYQHLGFVAVRTEKFSFFPFTCGYMEKQIL